MSKELTKEQRGAIIYCHQRGDSYRTIATTVGCEVSTVFDTLKRMDKTGTTDSRPRSGRLPLIGPSQQNRLKRLVTNNKGKNRRLCTAEIKQLWEKKLAKMFQVALLAGHFMQLALRIVLPDVNL